MRLLIDLQGSQWSSRQRGIGRYSLSLVEEMLRSCGSHEVWIALNRASPQSIPAIRQALDGLIPPERISVWSGPEQYRGYLASSPAIRNGSEILREAYFRNLEPDAVYVTSLFEGLNEGAITSVRRFDNSTPSVVTLYDLIPLIYKDKYLADERTQSWYARKLDDLRRAQVLLSISESARREAINLLGWPSDKIINISSAANGYFKCLDDRESACLHDAVRARGVDRPFVMYTGGIDFRKNIHGLIDAYALLPEDVRGRHQLVIVCAITDAQRSELSKHAVNLGLGRRDIVFTGFVSDSELRAFYNTCKVFCFPSLHEGFGLPILEAMQCGAPVIAANASSLPEVIGEPEALFDPRRIDDMTSKLKHVLTDDGFREVLRTRGRERAKAFSWKATAERAWRAIEQSCGDSKKVVPAQFSAAVRAAGERRRLAFVSPIPPQKSGIADYAAELLPELSRHYDIDVITNNSEQADPWIRGYCSVREYTWFYNNANLYDRILYQFGNSLFHHYMFELLDRHPGVVVLHDFFLGGVLAAMEKMGGSKIWAESIYRSHGYPGLRAYYQSGRIRREELERLIAAYPASLGVLQKAFGIVVHSDYSRRLAESFYSPAIMAKCVEVPLLRKLPALASKSAAREELGCAKADFVVCSVGVMGSVKFNHRLLAVWRRLNWHLDDQAKLVFAGPDDDSAYSNKLQSDFPDVLDGRHARIMGHLAANDFDRTLWAADVAVQLRETSQGESSASVLDSMARGVATVVNGIGPMQELPADCVVMLPEKFDDRELADALLRLRRDAVLRGRLGGRARAYVERRANPRDVSDTYFEAIETFYRDGTETTRRDVVASLAVEAAEGGSQADVVSFARSLARNQPFADGRRRILLDLSEFLAAGKGGRSEVEERFIRAIASDEARGPRLEPVHRDPSGTWRSAHAFMSEVFKFKEALTDRVVWLNACDILVSIKCSSRASLVWSQYPEVDVEGTRRCGIVFVLDGAAADVQQVTTLMETGGIGDGALCAPEDFVRQSEFSGGQDAAAGDTRTGWSVATKECVFGGADDVVCDWFWRLITRLLEL
jgi:glycosyltransferase involved in cell wall biosynthesis